MLYDVQRLTDMPGVSRLEAGPPDYDGRYSRIPPDVASDPTTLPMVPPLACTLFRKEDGSRTVTVTEGSVVEIIPTDAGDDGVLEYPVDLIWNDPDDGLLREHDILPDQYVGVAFEVDERGYVTAADPYIDVRTDPVSTHFTPPVGEDQVGAPGTVFVALAQLIGTAPDDRLLILGSGDNVYHYHDTPPFVCVGSGVDIFDRYDLAAGQYEYKGVVGISPIAVSSGGTDIEIELEGGRDLDLIVKKKLLVPGDPVTVQVPINIYGVTLTGAITGTGAHDHTIGDHTHGIPRHDHTYFDGGVEDRTSEGFLYETLTPLGDTDSSSGSTGTGEGTHDHEVTVTGDISTTVSIEIPTTPVFVVMDNYFTLCWRAGIYVGVYENGAVLPAESGNGLDTRTIYTLNDEYSELVFTELANTQLIPLL